MAYIEKCPICGKTISSSAASYMCPHCFAPVVNRNAQYTIGKIVFIIIAIVFVIICGIGAWVMFSS